MAKTDADRQREYRFRQAAKAQPLLVQAVREGIEAGNEEPYWIVKKYGQYPAPTPKPRQGKTPAEYQREYRKRARFKAAIEQIERLNTEQFQEG